MGKNKNISYQEKLEQILYKTQEWLNKRQSILDKIKIIYHKEIPEIRKEIDVLIQEYLWYR